jgi:uncharacterized glyoxalase superfamily protein PhnB
VRVFRIIVPVDDIDAGARFYGTLLAEPGERIWANRHYFRCGDVVLACVEPQDGRGAPHLADDPRIVYLAVDDLDAVFARARAAGPGRIDDEIAVRPWGERSFYLDDPFGNPLCFVAEGTAYTGGALEP